jgi:hypothetical protein
LLKEVAELMPIDRMRIPFLLSGIIIVLLITLGNVSASCSCSQSHYDQSFAKFDQSYGENRDSTDLISDTVRQIRSVRSERPSIPISSDKLKLPFVQSINESCHGGSCEGMNFKTRYVKAFKQALEKDGFTVQEGGFEYVNLIDLYFSNPDFMPTAAGNNPTTKYIGYLVPPAPGYEVPKLIAKKTATLGTSQNLYTYWNLGPDEAVVFVGRTPPKCRYFSFDSAMQAGTYEDKFLWMWPSIGDTLNNLVIKTEGTPNGRPGNPFNQTTVIIHTADRDIDHRIRAAAQSAGYPDSIINTMVFPSSMLHMGVNADSDILPDIFSTYIRPALYEDEQAGNDYLNNTPAVIFRVTPNKSAELDPYNVPKQRVRGSGTTEFALMDDLEELRMAILNQYSGLKARELPTSQWFPPSNDAFQKGINVYGPDNDACYLWTAKQTLSTQIPWINPVIEDFNHYYYPFMVDSEVYLGNNSNEFLIVYGVNHVATRKATYSSFVVYGAEGWYGVGAVTDADFNGTAEEYLPNNPNAKYLYVYKVARNCDEYESHCFEVPSDLNLTKKKYGIPVENPLLIGWRLYLEKATKTGPSYNEIVYDRAIEFDPNS